jgi:hypothetical protein
VTPPGPRRGDGLNDAAVLFLVTWRSTFRDLFAYYDFTMQCAEADAVCALYRAAGEDDTAQAIMELHAAHDTEEDEHYRPPGQREQDP